MIQTVHTLYNLNNFIFCIQASFKLDCCSTCSLKLHVHLFISFITFKPVVKNNGILNCKFGRNLTYLESDYNFSILYWLKEKLR